jgi:tetratricopeptide (TPR) repeat protein
MKQRSSLVMVLTITFLIITHSIGYAGEKYRSKGQWWIDMYTQVTPAKNEHINRAKDILSNLWNHAKRSDTKSPRLIVIPRKYDHEVTSQAFTLPDGSIIITETLLDLTLEKNADASIKGDSRLAFVLAHELTHLLSKDHEHFGSVLLFQQITDEDQLKDARLAELHADENGIFIMTMAGYNPKEVFDLDGTNFFADYQKSIRKKLKLARKQKGIEKHPEAILRANELRLRLVIFSEKLTLFSTGITRYQQGRFRQAEELFRTFFQYFPSREVANNIGVCFHQQALRQIIGCKDLHFQLKPAVFLEVNSRADIFKDYSREVQIGDEVLSTCKPDEQFRQLISSAKQYLDTAIQKSGNYRTASANMAALMITRENYPSAIQTIKSIIEEDPLSDYMKINLATALYLKNPNENRKRSLSLLEDIPHESPVFNHSRITLNQITDD